MFYLYAVPQIQILNITSNSRAFTTATFPGVKEQQRAAAPRHTTPLQGLAEAAPTPPWRGRARPARSAPRRAPRYRRRPPGAGPCSALGTNTHTLRFVSKSLLEQSPRAAKQWATTKLNIKRFSYQRYLNNTFLFLHSRSEQVLELKLPYAHVNLVLAW